MSTKNADRVVHGVYSLLEMDTEGMNHVSVYKASHWPGWTWQSWNKTKAKEGPEASISSISKQ